MENKKVIAGIIAILIIALVILLVVFGGTKEFTVTFDSNGGTEVEEQMVKKNEKAEEPESPTKEGYVFAGWYTEQDKKFSFNRKITEDITLTAKWNAQGENDITRVSIVASKSSLSVGDEITLTLKTTPANASLEDLDIEWSSSDETVVKVDDNGKITAVKAGRATVTVRVGDITSNISINVSEDSTSNNNSEEVATNPTSNPTTKPTTTSKATTKPTTKPSSNPTSNPTTKPTSNPTTAPTSNPTTTPTPVKETYDVKWENVPGSVIGEEMLYVVNSKGQKVAGKVTITTAAGQTIVENIPASGKKYVRSAIKNAVAVQD